MNKTGLAVIFTIGVLFQSAQTQAVNYTIQGLGTLGGSLSVATAINDSGVVVGKKSNKGSRNQFRLSPASIFISYYFITSNVESRCGAAV